MKAGPVKLSYDQFLLLREYKKRLNLSCDALAKELDLCKPTVVKVLRDRRTNIYPKTKNKIEVWLLRQQIHRLLTSDISDDD